MRVIFIGVLLMYSTRYYVSSEDSTLTRMGGIAISRLMRPFLWLVSLGIASLMLPVLLVFITPVLLVVWIAGLTLAIASPKFREHIGFTAPSYAAWLLLWPALVISLMVPALALGLAAVLHFHGSTPAHLAQLPAMIHGLLPEDWQPMLPQPSLSGWAAFCVVAGVIGFSSHCVYVMLDVPWRLKQIRHVRTLPRSRARSGAIGLSEFEGTARAEGADSSISPPLEGSATAFYLEDETGRIRVEPQEASLRPASVSSRSLELNEVEGGIRDGDHVYVIGFVQRRAPDSDELVVRPLRQRLVSSPVGGLLLPARRLLVDRDAPNIYIVEKGREHDVILRLRMALWDFSVYAGAYLASSLWLVHAAWRWL